MELPMYSQIKAFKDNYLKDFRELKTGKALIDYLYDLKEIYSKPELFNIEFSRVKKYLDEIKAKYSHDEIFDDFTEYLDNYHSFKEYERNLFPPLLNSYKNDFEMYFEMNLYLRSLFWEYESRIKEIISFIEDEISRNEYYSLSVAKQKPKKQQLSNAKKLALLYSLGILDLPKMKNLSEDKQNEIIGLLLDADKKEFVYKNRLNINSLDPKYQIDKYTAYQYLDEMDKLLSGI
jgi:hypothetical protein